MKTKSLLIVCLVITSFVGRAQKKLNGSIGYFGETISYPGIVAGIEIEKFESETYSVPTMLDIGFYKHPRSHSALFLELQRGTRKYGKGRFYYEHFLGVGLMLSFYSGEVWHVDQTGKATTISNFANPDLMPSISFGVGYQISKDKPGHIWMRPKVFWQLPYNHLALPHIALEVGYRHNINSN